MLSGNAGKKFGKLKQPAGTSIDVDSFNYRANAKKALGIAFNPFLESIVGPTDITRATPNLLLVEPQQQLRREVANSKTYGILPIVRLIAPVTEVDVKLLQDVQLGFEDPQEGYKGQSKKYCRWQLTQCIEALQKKALALR